MPPLRAPTPPLVLPVSPGSAIPKPVAPTLAASVALRWATPADAPALSALINRAYQRESWLIPGPRVSPGGLEAEMAPGNVVVVATLAGRPAGTVRVRLRPLPEEGTPPRPSPPELGLLAVDPAAQGSGLGPLLVAAAEEVAVRAGFDRIHLQCGYELGMYDYYFALGYQVVAVDLGRHFGARQPFRLVTMSKPLRWPPAGSVQPLRRWRRSLRARLAVVPKPREGEGE